MDYQQLPCLDVTALKLLKALVLLLARERGRQSIRPVDVVDLDLIELSPQGSYRRGELPFHCFDTRISPLLSSFVIYSNSGAPIRAE